MTKGQPQFSCEHNSPKIQNILHTECYSFLNMEM
jgi:hypothetical protein